jgi:hypothetical protein
MPSRITTFTVATLVAVPISVLLPAYIIDTKPVQCLLVNLLDKEKGRVVVSICLAAIFHRLIMWAVLRIWKSGDTSSIYGLQHGKLHLQVPTAMWMNMGYWKNRTDPTTLSEACRDLLKKVLAEAELSSEMQRGKMNADLLPERCLIDLGFGCGDQTVYLTSAVPLRHSDEAWWDGRERCVKFDHYIGITKDATQAQYASQRLLKQHNNDVATPANVKKDKNPRVELFCADAARPESWSPQLHASIHDAMQNSQDRWVLALDTAYHFSPSRWHLLKYIQTHLNASFMAFDLCLSPSATTLDRLMLRTLTTLMGAPWSNFVTPHEYRQRLKDAGYQTDMIKLVDISEHVFTPLAAFLDKHNQNIGTLGLGIGSLSLAGTMFGWWGRTGIVRGVIVVARQ